jgi:hypothetical protein
MSALWVVPAAVVGYLAGRVLHEVTHAAGVLCIPGARVTGLSLSGCGYDGVSELGRDVVDAIVAPGFVTLVVVSQLIVRPTTLPEMWAVGALYLGYIPRSKTDWRPWKNLWKRLSHNR